MVVMKVGCCGKVLRLQLTRPHRPLKAAAMLTPVLLKGGRYVIGAER